MIPPIRHLLLAAPLLIVAAAASAEPPSEPVPSSVGLRLEARPYLFSPSGRPGRLPAPGPPPLLAEADAPSAPASFGLHAVSWTERLGGIRRVELSRAGCAYKGLGAGANLGLWLGTLGWSADIWDERTAWYMAGAFAAAGAVLGGTLGSESATWSVRYEWDDINEQYFNE